MNVANDLRTNFCAEHYASRFEEYLERAKEFQDDEPLECNKIRVDLWTSGRCVLHSFALFLLLIIVTSGGRFVSMSRNPEVVHLQKVYQKLLSLHSLPSSVPPALPSLFLPLHLHLHPLLRVPWALQQHKLLPMWTVPSGTTRIRNTWCLIKCSTGTQAPVVMCQCREQSLLRTNGMVLRALQHKFSLVGLNANANQFLQDFNSIYNPFNHIQLPFPTNSPFIYHSVTPSASQTTVCLLYYCLILWNLIFNIFLWFKSTHCPSE